MRAFAYIRPRHVSPDPDLTRLVDLEQFKAFHGEEILPRQVQEMGDYKSYLINKNTYIMPHLFCPSLKPVVSIHVHDKLRHLPGIAFTPVRILADQWEPLDMGINIPLSQAMIRPDRHEVLPAYYRADVKLLWRDVKIDSPGYRPISVDLRLQPGEIERVAVALEMFNDYSIIWHSGLLFGDRAFRIIEPYLVKEFFFVDEYDENGKCILTWLPGWRAAQPGILDSALRDIESA